MSQPSAGRYFAWTSKGKVVDVAREGLPKDTVLICEEGPASVWVAPVAGGGPAGGGEGNKEDA